MNNSTIIKNIKELFLIGRHLEVGEIACNKGFNLTRINSSKWELDYKGEEICFITDNVISIDYIAVGEVSFAEKVKIATMLVEINPKYRLYEGFAKDFVANFVLGNMRDFLQEDGPIVETILNKLVSSNIGKAGYEVMINNLIKPLTLAEANNWANIARKIYKTLYFPEIKGRVKGYINALETARDIELFDKLVNLYEGEQIEDNTYDLVISDKKLFNKIGQYIISILKNSSSGRLEFIEDETYCLYMNNLIDRVDDYSAGLYNQDRLYLEAIKKYAI